MTSHDSTIGPGSADFRGPMPGSDAAALPEPRLWLLLVTADWCAPCRPAPTLLRELCRRHGSAVGGAMVTLDGSVARVSALPGAPSAVRPGRGERPHGTGTPPSAAPAAPAATTSVGAPGAPASIGSVTAARTSEGPTRPQVAGVTSDDLEISLGEAGSTALHLPLTGETEADPLLAALAIEELPTWIALIPVERGSDALVERARLVGALPKHTVEASLVLPHVTPTA